ncbi:GNAT family N-acetyltransferase [Terribacillus saccharophilus]|uniref:GNAT family N-acetyltransferase n=1 Tax=Terribacillus saccharophilus TaxID=361277 RepID=UPI002989FAAC|nr:GNAT family N-acetyltransferase [Terribacillus saccharophilus]MCM3224704.1 GNAT family N-acetyltransferase [Terribacillus saccharophilus]
MNSTQLKYKIATEPWEFEQVHALNYRTFTEEIPQHETNQERKRIDRFNQENTYIIGLDGDMVVAMIAIRSVRPFSLDEKIEGLDDYLPHHDAKCEIRLLAVEKAYRDSFVFFRLAEALIQYCLENGFDMAVISGVLRQQKLYKHMGFVAFGPLTGSGDAQFQPMYVTEELFQRKARAFQRIFLQNQDSISFLPGPVPMADQVKRAMGETACSHRAPAFLDHLHQLRGRLKSLTHAGHVQIMLGTGTLGNDAVAAQLRTLTEQGLILVNGEFGSRLTDHAQRAGLHFNTVEIPWGESFDYEHILAEAEACDAAWIWAVHSETSTGVLQDINQLKYITKKTNSKLVLDCCSSLGNVPLDLRDVFLATAGSGKGVASYAGLAFVFYHHTIEISNSIPRYLDLGLYHTYDSTPFTHSSNLIKALSAAIDQWEDAKLLQRVSELTDILIKHCREKGLTLLADAAYAPGIVTIVLPKEQRADIVGRELARKGCLISCNSSYLIERNWVQISVMGHHEEKDLERVTDALAVLIGKKETVV